MVRAPGRGIQVASIFAALMLAVAQPVFEQLARSAEFFIVRGTTTRELVILVAILCLAVPLVAFILITLARSVSERFADGIHAVIFFLSLTTLFLVGLNRVLSLPAYVVALISPLAAAFIVWGFYQFQSIRQFFLYLAVVTLIVPILFIRSPGISKIFFGEQPVPPKVNVSSNIPVVLVIFDELPLSTLLDSTGKIDAKHFPNFATLANRSYCFVNATSVADFTTQSIPAILTGRYARSDQYPIFSDHPENLFTMLGNSYNLVLFESASRLCPLEYAQRSSEKRTMSKQIIPMFKDLAALYLHMIIPADYRSTLPPVNQVWINFWGGQGSAVPAEADRLKSWNDFVAAIEPAEKPTLYFIHSQFPHSPWQFLPSGQQLKAVPLRSNDMPPNQKEIMMDRFRGHILQTAFTDRLLGRLIQRLSDAGLFEGSLIIVTADHGISFKRTTGFRGLRRDNFSDIMLVPLIIKLPRQQTGEMIRRNVETIDILPTIGDVLDVETPWAEGQSVLASGTPERKMKKMFHSGTQKTHEFGPRIAIDPMTNLWKLALIRNDPYFD